MKQAGICIAVAAAIILPGGFVASGIWWKFCKWKKAQEKK